MTTKPSELDDRLQQHHDALVAAFTGYELPPRELRTARSRRPVIVLAVALVALLALVVPVLTLRLLPGRGQATLQVDGFTVVAAADAAATPRMTSTQAVAAVETFLNRVSLRLPDGTPVTGVELGTPSFVAGVDNVTRPCIHVFIPQRENLWIVPMSAPPQHGWGPIIGGYLINDADGSLPGGDVLFAPQNGSYHC